MLIRFTLDRAGTSPVPPGAVRVTLLPALGLHLDFNRAAWWRFIGDWRKVVATLALALLATYLGLVTLLHAAWRSRPGNQVTWSHIALAPVQWGEFRIQRGETSIASAFLSLERGEINQAFFDLSAGLARSPDNTRARALLVEMIGAWDPHHANKLVSEGLERAPGDPALLRAAFAFHEKQQAPQLTLDLTAHLFDSVPTLALDAAAHTLARNARASALLTLGRASEAATVLATTEADSTTPDGQQALRLLVRAHTRAGHYAAADETWRRLVRAQPDAGENHLLEGELALAAGDDVRLASAIRRLKVAYPDSIDPLFFAYRAWHGRERATLRDAIEAEIFTYHGHDNAALQRFGNLLVELDLPEPLKRAQNAAAQHGINPFAFQAQMTDLALRRHDFDGAFRTLQQWEWLISNVKTAQRGYPEFLRRLVRATVDGGSSNSLLLVNHLVALRGQTTPAHFTYALTALERAGKLSAAVDVATIGARHFPFAEALRHKSDQLREAFARETAEQSATELAQRGTLASAFADADATFAQLDAALASGSFIAARQQLQVLRIARPRWFGEQEAAVELRRVQLAVLTEEAVDARLILRRYLGAYRTAADALALLTFARELSVRKLESSARLVQTEVAAARSSLPEVAAALEALGPDERWTALTQSPESAFSLLDEQLARNDPDSVLALLDQVRVARPEWLERAAPDLDAREVRARLALQQKPLAALIFRNLVLKSGLRRAAAFRLVRTYLADGDRPTATWLAEEIVKLLPDDRAALRLLRETSAPPLPLPAVEPSP